MKRTPSLVLVLFLSLAIGCTESADSRGSVARSTPASPGMGMAIGDSVRILSTADTLAAGYAGRTGTYFGFTTPSITGVESIGPRGHDLAFNVAFDDGTSAWFVPSLVVLDAAEAPSGTAAAVEVIHFSLSAQEEESLRPLLTQMSDRAMFTISLDYLLGHWTRFVARVEAGYDDDIADYDNDLDARYLLQEVLNAASPPLRERLEAAINPLDARFRAVTVERPTWRGWANGLWDSRFPTDPGPHLSRSVPAE